MTVMRLAIFHLLLLILLSSISGSHALLQQKPFTPSARPLLCSRPTTAVTACRLRPGNGATTYRMMMAIDPNHVLESIMHSTTFTSSSSIVVSLDDSSMAAATTADSVVSYSKASYYTILGLYLISLPGLWSTVKRTTKAKVQLKTYVSPGSASSSATSGGGKSLRQEAGEIMAYMKANNYIIKDNAGETITFEGVVQRSVSQAFFLTFVAVMGLASLALVLQIQFNELVLPLIGKPNWYLLSLLGPYAGIYYWKSGDRVDQCSVKLQTNEDESVNEIIVRGSEEELDRMWRTMGWREKGMVKVEGLLQQPY